MDGAVKGFFDVTKTLASSSSLCFTNFVSVFLVSGLHGHNFVFFVCYRLARRGKAKVTANIPALFVCVALLKSDMIISRVLLWLAIPGLCVIFASTSKTLEFPPRQVKTESFCFINDRSLSFLTWKLSPVFRPSLAELFSSIFFPKFFKTQELPWETWSIGCSLPRSDNYFTNSNSIVVSFLFKTLKRQSWGCSSIVLFCTCRY